MTQKGQKKVKKDIKKILQYMYNMTEYTCICCCFVTNNKTKYDRHLLTKKHLKFSQKLAEISPKLAEISPKKVIDTIECKYCEKTFKHHSSLLKHIKYTCKKNKDEDLNELVRLLNEQNQEMKVQNEIKDKQNEALLLQMDKMQRQIDKLTSKLQIQNIHNNNSNNTINYNIKLLNYNQTDYSHLTEQDYVKCIKDCNYCVKSLIEKVHFNEDKPENKNIYISNIKNKYIMMYKNNKWQIVSRKNQLDDLYDYNEVMLENWYDEYKDKYPEMIRSFERYLKNKDDDNLLNDVKDEILLMLYNNRLITNENIE